MLPIDTTTGFFNLAFSIAFHMISELIAFPPGEFILRTIDLTLGSLTDLSIDSIKVL